MDFAFFAIAFNIGKMCRKTNLKELKAVIKQRITFDKQNHIYHSKDLTISNTRAQLLPKICLNLIYNY